MASPKILMSRVGPEPEGSSPKGFIEKTIETVSEAFKGAAEGLYHGTQIFAGPIGENTEFAKERAVEGKEVIREGLYKVTDKPTPLDPSVADQTKESVKGLFNAVPDPNKDELVLQRQRHYTEQTTPISKEPLGAFTRAKEAIQNKLEEEPATVDTRDHLVMGKVSDEGSRPVIKKRLS